VSRAKTGVKAKKIAGITCRCRFHDLRHSFASRLASKGVSLQVIAKALGHTSSSTAERYARPNEEALQTVRDALDSGRAVDQRPDEYRRNPRER
jgi:site-specific recombinase XerD